MSLIGSEPKELRLALLNAYPTPFKLTEMVKDELEKDLDVIGNSLDEIVFTLIRDAEAEGWTDELIEAAHRKNPGNKMLSTFYCKYKQRQAQKQGSQTPKTATTTQQAQQDEEANEVQFIPNFKSEEKDEDQQIFPWPIKQPQQNEKTMQLQRLTGRERLELTNALIDAYPDQEDFDMMLQVNFDKSLNTFVDTHQDYRKVIFNLISKTQAAGWTEALITAAYNSNSGNEMLQKCYRKYIQKQIVKATFEQKDLEDEPDAEQRINGAGEARKKKPENQGVPEQKRSAEKLASDESFPNTRRGCIEKAQWNVKEAYDLLDPKMNILPTDIAVAVQFLETAKGDIEHLEELLKDPSPLPEHGRIIDQVRIITDQIDHYLIPDLKPSKLLGKDFQKKFGPLLSALKELDTLIPE